MLIEVANNTIQLADSQKTKAQIMELIEQELHAAGLYFSHFRADGVEYYDDLELFLTDHLHDLQGITIIGRTLQELAHEILLSAHDYLNRATPQVEQLAQGFYQEAQAEDWRQLEQLLEGLEWLLDSFAAIDREIVAHPLRLNYGNWDEYIRHIHQLKGILEQLAPAMAHRDSVLIADVLSYELAELFAHMQTSLQAMLALEV